MFVHDRNRNYSLHRIVVCPTSHYATESMSAASHELHHYLFHFYADVDRETYRFLPYFGITVVELFF